ncbi:MAG: hypothetical protein EAZ07_10050 [Cytophagales bacterium]|nr:MAG: hypothetical protein EAZ07_10050 [Cytophagales bacterium]
MKSFIKKSYILILLGLNIFIGCKKDDVSIPVYYLIQSEKLDTLDNSFLLYFKTSKRYECSNYNIENQFEISGNEFKISLSEIKKPQICLTASGPANCEQNFKQVKEGNYVVKFDINGSDIIGKLTISKSDIDFIIPNNNCINIENPKIKRVPKQVIWGNLTGKAILDDKTIYNKFLDSLVAIGAKKVNLPDGNYWYFKITNGEIFSEEIGDNKFIIEYSNNFEDVKKLVLKFEAKYKESLFIRIETGNGKVFAN